MADIINKGKGGISSIFSIFKFIFSLKGAIPITFILIILLSITSIVESVDTKTPVPFLKAIGGKLLNFEQKLYFDSKEIQHNKGLLVESKGFMGKLEYIWQIIKSLGKIFYGWWVLFFISLLFYKFAMLVFIQDDSKVTSLILITLMMLLFLEIFTNFVILDEDINQKDNSLALKFVPFKGIVESVKTVPFLFTPLYNQTIPIFNGNMTNNSYSLNNLTNDAIERNI